MHADDGARLLTRREERIEATILVVDAGQAELEGQAAARANGIARESGGVRLISLRGLRRRLPRPNSPVAGRN